MTKEDAIKTKNKYLHLIPSCVIGVWITNEQGTDDWFVDVHWDCLHRNKKDDFEKVGFDLVGY